MAQPRRFARRRSIIAASFAASAALTVAAGPMKTLTLEAEDSIPERTEQIIQGVEIEFLAPNAPVERTIGLGLDSGIGQAQGAYAEDFASDPDATDLSRDQIANAADEIAQVEDLRSITVKGKASDDDRNAGAGFGVGSEENQELAQVRGETTGPILREYLATRGVTLQVVVSTGEEIVLNEERILEFKRLVAESLNQEIDSVTEEQIEKIIEDFNDGIPVPESLLPFLTTDITANRGADITYTFMNPSSAFQSSFGVCQETTNYVTLVYPEVPAKDGQLPIPWVVPIPLFKKRREEQDSEELGSIENGKQPETILREQQVHANREHWSVKIDRFAYRLFGCIKTPKDASLARRAVPFIATAILVGGAGIALKPLYWGPELNRAGCKTGNNTFMPDPYQIETPPKKCEQLPGKKTPENKPMTLQVCLDQHPGARQEAFTSEAARVVVFER